MAFEDLIDLSDERLRAAVTKEEKKALDHYRLPFTVNQTVYVGEKLSQSIVKAVQSVCKKIDPSKAAPFMEEELSNLDEQTTVVITG